MHNISGPSLDCCFLRAATFFAQEQLTRCTKSYGECAV